MGRALREVLACFFAYFKSLSQNPISSENLKNWNCNKKKLKRGRGNESVDVKKTSTAREEPEE